MSVCLSLTVRLIDLQINLGVRVSHKANHCQTMNVHPGLPREVCLEMGGSVYTEGKGLVLWGTQWA